MPLFISKEWLKLLCGLGLTCAIFCGMLLMAVLDGLRSSPPTEEVKLLADEGSRKLARCLNRHDSAPLSTISVLDDDETCETITVPREALRLFIELLNQMAQGNIVTLFPIHAELTTQEAADLINVSRPFLVKQLEAGEIPFRKVGKHRRIKFQDLIDYKKKMDVSRNDALNELATLDQELGLGFD